MRVTQSMLSNNMLRNLSNSYAAMGKYQNQLDTGKKISRPSEDPVVATLGIGYRADLQRVEQFQRNLSQADSWLYNADTALGNVNAAMTRVKELLVDAANDTKTGSDREKIQKEIDQIQKQMVDLANTKVGSKYIFSGTDTDKPLMVDGAPPTVNANVKNGNDKVELEVFNGVNMQVNVTSAQAMFTQLNDLLTKASKAIGASPSDGASIGALLGDHEKVLDTVLETRADIGARQNRVELMENRLDDQFVSANKMISDNEDIDYEKVITELITQESVHRAALSVGSRIIQPSLVDFLR